jgi:cell division protein FtsA
MQGMVELGEEIFHMPVRVGYPAYQGALAEAVRHPRHSTGVGLLLAGLQQLRSRELARMNAGSFRQVMERMKTWFTGNF